MILLAGGRAKNRTHNSSVQSLSEYFDPSGDPVASSSHVVFSAFRSNTDPAFIGWVSFREQIHAGSGTTTPMPVPYGPAAPPHPGMEPAAAATAPFGIWRLLATNHREVGRSSFLYRSGAGARAHARQLQSLIEGKAVTVMSGPLAGTHGWFIEIDGSPVMTSARWYGSSATSYEAATGAIEALKNATINDEQTPAATPRRARNRQAADRSRASTW
jgi:hypothetical protein